MNKLEQMLYFAKTDVVCSTGNYLDFLQTKQKNIFFQGFDVDEKKKLNNNMFDFQKFIVKRH